MVSEMAAADRAYEQRMNGNAGKPCPDCKGSGSMRNEFAEFVNWKCPTCRGSGSVQS